MSKIALDLKQFKHIKSNGDTTTLQHKAGHVLTIANKALSPESQKQLSALSKIGQDARTSNQTQEAQDQKMAEGGKVAKYCQYCGDDSHAGECMADGGRVYDKEDMKKQYREKNFPQGEQTINYKDFPKITERKNKGYTKEELAQPRKKFAEGTPDGTVESDNSFAKPQDETEEKTGILPAIESLFNGQEGRNDWAKPEFNVAKNDIQPAQQGGGGATGDFSPSPAQSAPDMVPSSPAPSSDQNAAVSSNDDQGDPTDQQPAMAEEDPTTDAMGNGPSTNAIPAPMNPQQQMASHKQEIGNELDKEDQAWNQDLMNGHIQPKTYKDLFADKSTLGKIGTVFGLILSGMGSGLTHQPNALLEMMNNTIKRDLDAQMKSKDNAQNYLKLNMQNSLNQGTLAKMQQEGKLNDAQAKMMNTEASTKAYALANMQMNRVALHSLATQVDQMPQGSPQRQQAEQTLAMMNNAVQSENYNLKDRAATAGAYGRMMFGQQQGSGNAQQTDSEEAFKQKMRGMRMLGPDGARNAEDQESKHISGFGNQVASKSVTDKDRDMIVAHQDVNNLLNEAQSISKMGAAAKTNPKLMARVPTLMNELQSKIRTAEDQGVFKKSEADFMKETLGGSPTSFLSSFTSDPKLSELQRIKNNEYQTLAGKYGLKVPQAQLQQSAPEVQTKNGIRYQKVPGGWVPIK